MKNSYLLVCWALAVSFIAEASSRNSVWEITHLPSLKFPVQETKVQINEPNILALDVGQRFSAPLGIQTLQGEVVQVEMQNGIRLIKAKNINNSQLPNTLLAIDASGVSAWIPTEKGSFRVQNGVLKKERKVSGEAPDFKVPDARSQGFSPISPENFNDSIPSMQAASASYLQYKLLFVLTDEFVQAYPGIGLTLTMWVSANNSIYEASGINTRVVNAGYIQADLESVNESYLLEVLSNNAGAAEGTLTSPVTLDVLNTIWDKRVETKADFVVVLKYNQIEDICGVAWLNGNSNQVYSYEYSYNITIDTIDFGNGSTAPCGYDTLGHEVGHNMGLGHSLEQGSTGTVFDFGRGYGVVDQFATVMAYPSAFGSASGVSLYSSPDLTCLDVFACGVDRNTSSGADAVYAINEVVPEITRIYDEANANFAIADAISNLSDSQLATCIQSGIDMERVVTQFGSVSCSGVASLSGFEAFTEMFFINLRGSTNLTDITAMGSMSRLATLDLVNTQVSDFTPLAHVKDVLQVFYTSVDNVSCQQVNVVENAWGIDDFQYIGTCLSLANDNEDFDSDGVTNLDDTDDDNDGLDDITDAKPFDATNGDDIDGDGTPDSSDAFPFDPAEQTDTDSDGVGNNADTDDDNDGMSDSFETQYGLDPLSSNDASTDLDSDGLSNLQEFQLGTFPNDSDSDNDGINDGDEVTAGTDPLVNESSGSLGTKADFNGDGFADMIYRDTTSNQWSIHLMNEEQATVTDNVSGMSVVTSWQYNGTGDFNGDGNDDIVIRNAVSGQWYIYNFNGSNIVSRGYVGIESASLVEVRAVADFNLDQRDDVLLRNVETGEWSMSLINNRSVTSVLFPPMSRVTSWDIVDAADFDSNGSPDILIRNSSSGSWYIYLYNSTSITNRGYITSLTSDLDEPVQGVADFDGDGASDLLLRNSDSGNWTMILMNGLSPKSTLTLALPSSASWQFHTADDFDADGKADVVIRNGNSLRTYYLNADTVLRQQDINVNLSETQQIQALN